MAQETLFSDVLSRKAFADRLWRVACGVWRVACGLWLVAKSYSSAKHGWALLMSSMPPRHRGGLIEDVSAEPHLGSMRLPSYSSQFNVVERSREMLLRCATHNLPFDNIKKLEGSLRAIPC